MRSRRTPYPRHNDDVRFEVHGEFECPGENDRAIFGLDRDASASPDSDGPATTCERATRIARAFRKRLIAGVPGWFDPSLARDNLVGHSVRRAVHVAQHVPGGTASVNQTPFADNKNLCPSRCIPPASTRRMTGLPRLAPTLRAVSTSFERCTWCRLPRIRPCSMIDFRNQSTVP